jgi:hypothetical protein
MNSACLALPDISLKKVAGKCDFKCSFSYQYPDMSQCVLTHYATYLSGTVLSGRDQVQVLYQDQNYSLREFRIYAPSLHTFEEKQQPGEIVFIHTQIDGGTDLVVCFPILASDTGGNASAVLSSVVDEVVQHAPNVGDSSTIHWENPINMDVFFTSNKPFLTYTAPPPFEECSADQSPSSIIVYPLSSSLAYLSSAKLSSLSDIISPSPSPANGIEGETSYPLYWNPNGADTAFHRDPNVYIDCQPVGEAETDSSSSAATKPTSTFSSGNVPPILWFFLIVLVVVFFFYLAYHGLKKLREVGAKGAL